MREEIIERETRFWQSMVDQDADTAVSMLCEPAVMVSGHGALKFDHAAYKKMADEGPMVITGFEFKNMDVVFPNDDTAVLTYHVKQTLQPRDKGKTVTQEVTDSSTWVRRGKNWLCAIHTETPAIRA
jgi:ketosteroid isomerase-like protein